MDFCVKYVNDLFEIKTSGDAGPRGFGDLLDGLLEHEEWQPGASFLMDHTGLNSNPLSTNEMKAIAKICESRGPELGASKCALLVTSDLEFGLARMWDVYVEDRWNVITELFRSRDAAISWLSE